MNEIPHSVFKNMRQRCLNKNNWRYRLYGARGISVCDQWSTYKGFAKDMQKTYKPGLTLDRIDNNKGYSKENCRWATIKEQCNNRNRCRWFTYKGMTKNVSQWAKYLGLKQSTMSMRIHYGWSIEKCFAARGSQ